MKEPINSNVLLINDIHVDRDNVLEFTKNWDEAIYICEEYGARTIIVGGDMFKSTASQTLATLKSVSIALLKAKKRGLEVIIAEGNHDLVDPEDVFGYSHVFRYDNVTLVDYFLSVCLSNDVILHIMSYAPNKGSFIPRLNTLIESLDKVKTNILYCHQGIRGGLTRPTDDELPAEIFQPFDRVFAGHYHDRAVIEGTNIEYIGASRQHTFGENSEKGYTVLYPDGHSKFVRNTVNAIYKTISVTSQEEAAEALKSLSGEDNIKVRVWIEAEGDFAPRVDKSMLYELGATKIEVKEQKKLVAAESNNFSQRFDKSGLKQEYVSFCKKKEFNDIDLGLKYLDKIKDNVETD